MVYVGSFYDIVLEVESSPMLGQQNVYRNFLIIKTVSDVFVFTLTQHSRVGLMSNRCQSSVCIRAADEN